MKVVLTQNVEKVGNAGDVKNVTGGFARNYLFPRELAWEATSSNLKRWEDKKKSYLRLSARELDKAQQRADKIGKESCTINVKTDNEDKIFGSVTNMDIAKSLLSKGIEVDKKDIILEEPIHKVGAYTVKVRVHQQVYAELKVWVVAEDTEKSES
ncbi:MAG: 50S ribosomal protein L9 [Elusimicrobiota bacterium]